MRYFIHLAYDGTAYSGWQVQPGVPTVQAALNEALSKVLRQPVRTQGSGRTDAGVHARHQVAHFEADFPPEMTLELLRYRLNRALPRDVQVARIEEVPASANARFSALGPHLRVRGDAGARPVSARPGPLLGPPPQRGPDERGGGLPGGPSATSRPSRR